MKLSRDQKRKKKLKARTPKPKPHTPGRRLTRAYRDGKTVAMHHQ